MQEAIRVNVFRSQRSQRSQTEPSDIHADLAKAAALAKLMDAQFQVGNIKLGADAVIGLIPIAGDAISFAIGMYPVYLARKHKLGKRVIGRMLLNLGADFVAGSVPLVGDVFDVAFKANLKNYALLNEAAEKSAQAAVKAPPNRVQSDR